MSTLTDLVEAAGHVDFRDARGPLGLSQRQAKGRFTRDEADELIETLEIAADSGTEIVAPAAGSVTGTHGTAATSRRPAGGATAANSAPTARKTQVRAKPVRRITPGPDGPLSAISDADLAAELQRRGWLVMEP